MTQQTIAATQHSAQQAPNRAVGKLPEPVAQALADAVSDLRFGVIQLTVHDGKVVQLDVTERQRF